MKENTVEIVAILDRSGSMSVGVEDVIGGFNIFVAEQKKVPGEAFMTLVQFDNEYKEDYIHLPLEQVPDLDSTTYVPRGSTALLDAIGRTFNAVGARLARLPEEERPEKVIVLIFTDGGENASREFRRHKVVEMIDLQRKKYSWEILFFGAGPEAFAEGNSLGLDSSSIFRAHALGGTGTYEGLRHASKSVTESRIIRRKS